MASLSLRCLSSLRSSSSISELRQRYIVLRQSPGRLLLPFDQEYRCLSDPQATSSRSIHQDWVFHSMLGSSPRSVSLADASFLEVYCPVVAAWHTLPEEELTDGPGLTAAGESSRARRGRPRGLQISARAGLEHGSQRQRRTATSIPRELARPPDGHMHKRTTMVRPPIPGQTCGGIRRWRNGRSSRRCDRRRRGGDLDRFQ